MKAQDPLTGQWKYFVDKCLPFGASISCALFQRFSNALHHLIEYKLQVKKRVTNYLDDFLFIARAMGLCNKMISQFLLLCEDIGVPISMEKTEWASELLIFFGILLDGKNLILAIPEEKRARALELLNDLLGRKKTTVGHLQKLCGFLNFLCKSIYLGHAFTRRMYAKYSNVIHLHGTPQNAREYKVKQHHHVMIDSQFKLDCEVWIQFLSNSDIQRVVNKPMIDFANKKEDDSVEIGFYSDASAAKQLGCRAILKNRWIKAKWNEHFITDCKPSIEYLELFALTAGVLAWENCEEMKDRKIRLHCDNQAVVQMVNNLTSSCKNCMVLIRILILNGLLANRKLSAVYVRTCDNGLADALSRDQMS